MLQAVNTDLFNPSVPNDQNSECQNRKKSLKASLRIFIFCTLSTNGLKNVGAWSDLKRLLRTAASGSAPRWSIKTQGPRTAGHLHQNGRDRPVSFV